MIFTFRDGEQSGGCWIRALRDGTLAGTGLLLYHGGGYLELHEGYSGRESHTHWGHLNKLCGMEQCPFHDALAL